MTSEQKDFFNPTEEYAKESPTVEPEIKKQNVTRSETLGKLFLALSKAQIQIQGAVKDSSNPYFKSNYADLASVWEACHKQLNSNDIAVIQLLSEGTNVITVETILGHSSGEFISEKLSFIPKAKDPQGMGSAVTYARRYALSAIAGVCPMDDDGEASMGRKVPEATKPAYQGYAKPDLMNSLRK